MKILNIVGEGANLHTIQRQIWTKLHAECTRYNVTEFITNAQVATMLQDLCEFEVSYQTMDSTSTEPYFIGTVDGVKVMVDPNMKWYDNTVKSEAFIISIDVEGGMF